MLCPQYGILKMASITDEIALAVPQFFTLYKDGRIDRHRQPGYATACDNPDAAVRSRDIVINPETGTSVRLYLPKVADAEQKLPLAIYIHGGAFVMGSTGWVTYHNFITSVVEQGKVIAASVEYRLAPEHPLQAAYDDSWEAFQWTMSHRHGKGPDPWLTDHADFGRVFLGGESAGANIAHDVALRAGSSGDYRDWKISGLFLIHPFFGGKEEDQLYKLLCPESSGVDDDPRLNPAVDPRLAQMACKKVLFHVAENDFLLARAKAYYEALKNGGVWKGDVEILEIEGEGHGFHLLNPANPKAGIVAKDLVTFLTQV
ncbi:unnamed protein product [Cuscuta europaea]|uniref:Alpha/beta hydrolase fold-3 domain-containing protein n=1 Tax=Cuscuta europaea TaxID=41803 RepID=A0A9P1EE29_CUSEU|nr:unnamed protein product [Cuscuta europaea]